MLRVRWLTPRPTVKSPSSRRRTLPCEHNWRRPLEANLSSEVHHLTSASRSAHGRSTRPRSTLASRTRASGQGETARLGSTISSSSHRRCATTDTLCHTAKAQLTPAQRLRTLARLRRWRATFPCSQRDSRSLPAMPESIRRGRSKCRLRRGLTVSLMETDELRAAVWRPSTTAPRRTGWRELSMSPRSFHSTFANSPHSDYAYDPSRQAREQQQQEGSLGGEQRRDHTSQPTSSHHDFISPQHQQQHYYQQLEGDIPRFTDPGAASFVPTTALDSSSFRVGDQRHSLAQPSNVRTSFTPTRGITPMPTPNRFGSAQNGSSASLSYSSLADLWLPSVCRRLPVSSYLAAAPTFPPSPTSASVRPFARFDGHPSAWLELVHLPRWRRVFRWRRRVPIGFEFEVNCAGKLPFMCCIIIRFSVSTSAVGRREFAPLELEPSQGCASFRTEGSRGHPAAVGASRLFAAGLATPSECAQRCLSSALSLQRHLSSYRTPCLSTATPTLTPVATPAPTPRRARSLPTWTTQSTTPTFSGRQMN